MLICNEVGTLPTHFSTVYALRTTNEEPALRGVKKVLGCIVVAIKAGEARKKLRAVLDRRVIVTTIFCASFLFIEYK